ncbi:uncharacterized protein N0V89_000945 [Didymosphaeria variabile]|uniref:Uncharacterized protein n=1 Tax=Didymosphaeria variabile TaxID=1932322 RepID=A0A9W8XW59_9PLEO|nr:uncharacterized protein N0V89_000945 [Didymosphaeria variabile]KAJ4360383.1 hypothetical protein N0V89_000945 [Didymosphaeria variabile]
MCEGALRKLLGADVPKSAVQPFVVSTAGHGIIAGIPDDVDVVALEDEVVGIKIVTPRVGEVTLEGIEIPDDSFSVVEELCGSSVGILNTASVALLDLLSHDGRTAVKVELVLSKEVLVLLFVANERDMDVESEEADKVVVGLEIAEAEEWLLCDEKSSELVVTLAEGSNETRLSEDNNVDERPKLISTLTEEVNKVRLSGREEPTAELRLISDDTLDIELSVVDEFAAGGALEVRPVEDARLTEVCFAVDDMLKEPSEVLGTVSEE